MKKSKRNKIIKIVAASVLSITTVVGYMIYLDLSSYKGGIQEPFTESVPFITNSFNNKDGFELHQPNGTHIQIPKNAFQDANGKLVKGNVELKFREFHTAESILMSGIPMQMLNDRNQYMESLGMMELRAFKDGKELSLKSGKKVKVDLASTAKPTKDFKLYFLEDDKQWKETGSFVTVNNDRRDNALANLPPISSIPETPESPELDANDIVFVLNGNTKHSPHLKPYKGVEWKLVTKPGEEVPYWAFRLNWDKIKIKPVKGEKRLFDITFKYSKKTHDEKTVKHAVTIQAVPQLTGKELRLAKKQYKEEYANFEVLLEKIALEQEKLALEQERLGLESSVLNRFEINKLGIANVDCLYKLDVYVQVQLKFDFENNVSPKFTKVRMFMVMEEINSVVKYNAFDWDEVSVIDTRTELIMVLPGGIVARVSPEEFQKKINTSTVSKHFTNTFYFETEKMTMEEYLKSQKENSAGTPMFL
jgi:hypothetical protein